MLGPVLFLLASTPATAWACSEHIEPSQLGRLLEPEVLLFGLLGASLLSAAVLLPAFLFGRAAPRCPACRERTLARWVDGVVPCAGCGRAVAVNGHRRYLAAWCSSVALALLLACMFASANLLSHDEALLIGGLWGLTGLVSAAASRLAAARVPGHDLPRAQVR